FEREPPLSETQFMGLTSIRGRPPRMRVRDSWFLVESAASACPAGAVPQDAHLLEGPERQKLRRNQEVAFPQARRFHEEAEEPLQAGFLHPARRLPHALCMEVEGRPYSDQDLSGEVPLVGCHPLFLLRRTDPDEDQVGPASAYHLLDVLVFRRCKRTERWGIRSDDGELRISCLQFTAKERKDLWQGAIKKYTMAAARGCLAEPQHQRRSVNPLLPADSE